MTAAPVEPGVPPPSPRHVRRLPPARQWPGLAAQNVRTYSSRPSGRLVLPGVLIALLVAVTGTVGAFLIPATAGGRSAAGPAVSQDAGRPTEDPTIAAPEPPPALPTSFPTSVPTGAEGTGREAAKLAVWAAPVATRLQIPQTALEAYGYAQWVMEQTQPTCKLSWTTLAGIGKVESDHGSTGGATMTNDGGVYPPIIGPALDGQGGRRLIEDTDDGALDNDVVYDRAVGPMQFIPRTWADWAIDADSNGTKDPHDIDDAVLSAAKYLCANGRDMSTPAGWSQAILAYNNVAAYETAVFDAANRYGQQSRNTP